VLCAGIAAAGENCVDAAAWSVVAEIGSSKRMEGVSAVSANSPRYRGCCGCRARRAEPAQVPAVAAVSEFAVVASSRGFLSTTGIDLRNLICLGGLLCPLARLTLTASQGGNLT
jgi:hypothetical protein